MEFWNRIGKLEIEIDRKSAIPSKNKLEDGSIVSDQQQVLNQKKSDYIIKSV